MDIEVDHAAVHAKINALLPDLSELPPEREVGWWGHVGLIEELIRAEVDRQRARTRFDEPDLAVVVIRSNPNGDIKKVIAALRRLQIPYLEQHSGMNRRKALERGQVRLVTAHSARGLEADRVLLIDLEGLEGIAENRNTLLNIALSRGRNGTRIVVVGAAQSESHRQFVEALLAAYRSDESSDTTG